VGEARAKVGSINVELLLAWDVHILATGAVDLHARCAEVLTDADGQHVLPFAKHSRAVAELA